MVVFGSKACPLTGKRSTQTDWFGGKRSTQTDWIGTYYYTKMKREHGTKSSFDVCGFELEKKTKRKCHSGKVFLEQRQGRRAVIFFIQMSCHPKEIYIYFQILPRFVVDACSRKGTIRKRVISNIKPVFCPETCVASLELALDNDKFTSLPDCVDTEAIYIHKLNVRRPRDKPSC
jgi:hypothetical protein